MGPARQLPEKDSVDVVEEHEVVKGTYKPTSAEIIRVRDGKARPHARKNIATPITAESSSVTAANITQKTASAADAKQIPDAQEPSSPVTEADSATPILHEEVRASIGPFIVGGLSGAVFAVFAVFLINKLSPAVDPRMQPMAEQLGSFIERMERHESGLQAAQVDLVGLLEEDSGSVDLGKERDARISRALAEVDLVRQELKVGNGPGSPVFSVAVAQLGNAVSRGEPFEAEWVTLFALTASTPDLRARLQRLLPLARTGVNTIETLRASLRSLSLKNGIPNNSNNGGIIHMGTMFLQHQLGIPIGNTPIQQVMGKLMEDVDRRLQAGDIRAAIQLVGGVGGKYTEILSPWLQRAERHHAAVTVALDLKNTAKQKLRERVSGNSSNSGAQQSVVKP